MRILNFTEFKLNENQSGDYETTDIKNLMDGGYEIICDDFLDKDSTPPTGKILVVGDDDSHVKISFCDRFGKMQDGIRIPKDSIKLSKNTDDQYTIKLDPNLRWMNISSNRDKLEDFIEDYINSKLDLETYKTRFIDSIKDDIYFIMDIMGIPCEVQDVKRTDDDNKYEVSLDNGIVIDVKKRSSDELVGNFDVYKKYSDVYPSISINSDSGKMKFIFNPEELDSEEVESNITEISKNDYLNFLLKKSLGLETTDDEERLYKHFLDTVDRREWDYSDIDEDEKKERGRKSAKYIKKLKKLVLSFLPETKVKDILPDKD